MCIPTTVSFFTVRQHEVFDDNQVKRTKWIKPNIKAASTKEETIVLAKLLQKDFLNLSPTFVVEFYHSVINYFAPKLHVFSYHGMHGCLLLAALHYNENAHRSQATTRDGTFAICHQNFLSSRMVYCVRSWCDRRRTWQTVGF